MAVEVVDVEMMEVGGAGRDVESTKPDLDAVFLEDMKEHAKFIEKSVSTRDNRFCYRVVMALPSTRKRLNANVLKKLVCCSYGAQKNQRDTLLQFIDHQINVDEFVGKKSKAPQTPHLLPEHDVYFHLLVLIYLIDQQQYNTAVNCSDLLMSKIEEYSRRSLDIIAAKGYFYLSRSYELAGRLPDIRSFLLARLQISILRKDADGQAVLLNCLLRNYLDNQLYEQAAKLIEKCQKFPANASNNEWARYFYYRGRIEAIQLRYSDAYGSLSQAIRKAPQTTAVGFKQVVNKLAVTVKLLMGEIPDRDIFKQPYLRSSLQPYFRLTQAVRHGDLLLFNEVVENFQAHFVEDKMFTLIMRLRHNVIRAGIRLINLSYSCIYLEDIAIKLKLDCSEDVEYIVSKAIRDGVIEACINHDEGYVQSKEVVDVYCTREPQRVFDKRVNFCLDIHNLAVKAMRFPPKPRGQELDQAGDKTEINLDFNQLIFDDFDDDNDDIY